MVEEKDPSLHGRKVKTVRKVIDSKAPLIHAKRNNEKVFKYVNGRKIAREAGWPLEYGRGV